MSDEVCSFDLLLTGSLYAGEVPCIGFFVAKALGLAILLGSVLLKAPQIFNIMATKSAEGLSLYSLYIEVPTSVTSIVYNYKENNPITSYGESIFITIQTLIICVLVWINIKPPVTAAHITMVSTTFIALTVGMVALPAEYLYLLPMSGIPLMVSSRVAQIAACYKAGSTGQLSSITMFLNFAGSLARVFTTIQEVGYDFSLISGFALGGFLSAVLLGQIVYYGYNVKTKKE